MTEAVGRSADSVGLSRRLRRQADGLSHEGRAPLYVALTRGAADDLEAGGIVAELFDGVPVLPGSYPALRLMAALHDRVLAGVAPELAAFFASAGGGADPQAAWPAAQRTLREHAGWVRARLPDTLQTNEPGRSTVLYAALLWLTAQHRRPIRLLEIGASAGLNLACDEFAYDQDGVRLGDPGSPLVFAQPWAPPPPIDLADAAGRLELVARGGCDLHPLDPRDDDDRRRLLSYIWPDDTERFARERAALEVAARVAPPITAGPAGPWLAQALAARRPGELTVVWESVMRQYVPVAEWAEIEGAIREQLGADPQRPVVWAAMEPYQDGPSHCALTLATGPQASSDVILADSRDHGPPVSWRHARVPQDGADAVD